MRLGKRRTSRGFAFVVLLAFMTVGALYLFVSQLDAAAIERKREAATTLALAQAKEALIAYAVAYPERHPVGSPPRAAYVPGHLPCPDSNGAIGNEGNEDPNCGAKGVTVVGYLPWKTLGLPPPRDGWGNCLWYAVSGNFKANPKADLLNWDSPGQFQVVGRDGATVLAGANADTRPVAVVFSPGPALPGQARANGGGECGGDYVAGHFLDALGAVNNGLPNPTAEGVSTVIAEATAGNNDRLAWITRDDIFVRGIQRRSDLNSALHRLARQVAECVAAYGKSNVGRRLPWAAPLALADHMPNTYESDRFNDSIKLLVGRIAFQIRDSYVASGSGLPSFAGCTAAGATGCRLYRIDNCPMILDIAGDATATDSPDGWFDKWKDHIYYAVAEDFQPSSSIPAADLCASPTASGRKCLHVGGVGPYAAVVMFAGGRQPGQTRTTLDNRNSPANYLEGGNAEAIGNNTPASAAFGKFFKAGNDDIVCIRKDLTIDESCSSP